MIYVHIAIFLVACYLTYIKKLQRKQLLLLIGSVVIGIVHMYTLQPEQASFQREDYGEEDSIETVYVGEEKHGKDWQTYEIVVPSLQYTKEELDVLSNQAIKQLGEVLSGDNASLSAIQTDVSMVEELEGFPFDISWHSSDTELITLEGQVLNADLPEAIDCLLTAELVYQDAIYYGEYVLTVQPPHLSEQEIEQRRLLGLIDDVIRAQDDNAVVTIPEQLERYWIYKTPATKWHSLLWPGLVIVFFLYGDARRKDKLRQQEKARRSALLQAYPYFVNQLVLYLGAGMTVKGAMEQIRLSMIRAKKAHLQILCEEINGMFYEMESGVSERQAYHNFARRLADCGYNKIMALMVQNLTLGSKGLLSRLEELEQDAFIRQKEWKRTKGEEASTKLLLPMVVLLGVTMLLIVVPGFLGMG